MAELSYDDVRRAAQDAVRELQSVVYGLRNNTDDMRRVLQQTSPTQSQSQNQLTDLSNRLNLLQNQITSLDAGLRNQTNPTQTLQNLQQGLGDLQRRLTAMEEFVHFIYRYFNALQQRADDEQGYRSQ